MLCSTLFSGSDTDSVGDAQVPFVQDSPSAGESNLMDSILLAEWEDRAEQGLFRYDVTACPTQLVPGTYGFIAQCNEGRASKKRATEFRVDQVSALSCWMLHCGLASDGYESRAMCAAQQFCSHSTAGHRLHVDVMHENKCVTHSKEGPLCVEYGVMSAHAAVHPHMHLHR